MTKKKRRKRIKPISAMCKSSPLFDPKILVMNNNHCSAPKIIISPHENSKRRKSPVKMLSLFNLLLVLFLVSQSIVLRVFCDTDNIMRDSVDNLGHQRPDGVLVSAGTPNIVVGSRWQRQLFLPCKFDNLDDDQTVSWIRKRDSLVLTIDKVKLIDDDRFSLVTPAMASSLKQQQQQADRVLQDTGRQLQSLAASDWSLGLREPSDSDAGVYECQVSSLIPAVSHLVELRMVPTRSHIYQSSSSEAQFGANVSALLVRPGETIHLTCSIEAPDVTDFVYWYKNKEPLQYDQLRPLSDKQNKLTKLTTNRIATVKFNKQQQASKYSSAKQNNNKLDNNLGNISEPSVSTSSSSFSLGAAQLNDTANYTCAPSNAQPSSINIIVVPNGLQSQPEKRSLSSTDGGALSLRPKLIIIISLCQLLRISLIDLRLSRDFPSR